MLTPPLIEKTSNLYFLFICFSNPEEIFSTNIWTAPAILSNL